MCVTRVIRTKHSMSSFNIKSLHTVILEFLVHHALHRQIGPRTKFAPRNGKCLFVVYPFGQKVYRVYDLETQEFFLSRDVFHKHSPNFKVQSTRGQCRGDWGCSNLMWRCWGEPMTSLVQIRDTTSTSEQLSMRSTDPCRFGPRLCCTGGDGVRITSRCPGRVVKHAAE